MWDLSHFPCFESGENCTYLSTLLHTWDPYVGLSWVGEKCLNKSINGEGVSFGISESSSDYAYQEHPV